MPALARDESVTAQARATTRRVAKTFSLAARLLPRDVRDDVYLLYLVFRTLDDLVDDGMPDAAERVGLVEAWCDGAAPASLETDVLACLDERYDLPRDALRDFCAGMRSDLAGVRIQTDGDLDRYCYQVAGTVGVTMTALLGTNDPEAARPAAAALGRAMQRTNILRDIDEDTAAGRVYLPADALARGGSLAPGQRESILRDQIARADADYEQGIAGIDLLLRGRRAITAAAAMYREILRQIERDGYGQQPGRAIVPRRRKLVVAARATL